MGSLPKSYSQTISSIATTSKITGTTATPQVIISLVTNEYNKRTVKSGRIPDEALAADSHKGKKGKKRNVKCDNCHKKGHTKAECWAKGGGNKGGGPKQKDKKADEGDGKKAEAAAVEQTDADIEAWAVVEELPKVPIVAIQGKSAVQCELFDSGASRHMSLTCESFTNYKKIAPRLITATNNKIFHAVGMGDLQIDIPNGASSTKVMLRDTLHAPDLGLTVVSIGHIVQAGYTVEFTDGCCNIKKKSDGHIIGSVPAGLNGLFKVDHVLSATVLDEPMDILMLHRKLGHISVNAICGLICSNAITGLHVINNLPPFTCDSCEYAKTMHKAIKKEREAPPAQAFSEEVHTDVWGPSPTYSMGGWRYYVSFTDDYSRYTKLEVLKTKDQAFEAYKSFAAWSHTQHSVRIKCLRSDRGGEFTSREFTTFLHEQGTERRLTTADMPQHNGVAESLNRRLMECVRAMRHQADLPKTLWAEAIQHAIWLKNCTSMKVLGNMTPYECLYQRKPNLVNIPEWGQNVWVYNAKGSKLDTRAKQARWVSFDADTHCHELKS